MSEQKVDKKPCDHWWETSGYPGGTTSRCSRCGATKPPGQTDADKDSA